LNFGDALKHWEGRFHKITLEDRNLPAIAERRVLKCHTPSARQELNAAFELTAKIRESVMTTLLTGEGDREMFRKVYPFSPALVQTLIAVSSVLQRERTALKVMMQLLVEQRDVLTVGDIVPVGDLFDVIAHGDEAFSQEMAIHFDNAKRLYHQKLLPMLEKTHGRREELEKLPTDDPRRVGFRNDDRLVKTLLLSALVPEVETLRGLNAERLAALNHGTIKTPIAGREGQEVLRRVRNWAASVGEIRIGEETNPSISIQLSGVDTEGIIKQAEREDNQGNRIRRVRQMLFEQLGVSGEDEFQQHYNFTWKNTSRSCTVLFKNIRELPDASFENNDADWKLVIDFPFDEAGYGPKDDISQLQAFKSRNPLGAKTICWIPQFFSTDALKDLGMLVILEHILAGERFGQYSNLLSPQDRQAAKSLLENQRSVLRTRVQNHLDAAYGLDAITQGSLDTTHELEQHEQFVSLDDGFDPQPPVAANLGGAMNHLLSQALMSEFPGAPNFEAEVKIGNLRKVQAVLSEAAQSQDGRVAVEKTIRSLVRHIANPLQLGEMGHDATHFVLGHHWRNHFNKKAAEASSTISVGQLRKWIDQPRAMGLPKEAQNLVILTYAEQTNRTFVFHNAPVDVSLTNLSNDFVLQEQKLPDEAHWNVAVSRAAQIFGEAVSPLMKATTVANLSAALKKKSSEVRSACVTLQERLKDRLLKLGVEPADSSRLTTASATASLVEKLHATEAGQVVSALASAAVATTAAAMGECLSKSSQLLATIESTNWEIFDAIAKLADDRQTVAQSIRSSIAQALQSDEHVTSLGPTLKEAQLKAVRLLTQTPPPPVQVPVPAVTPPVAGVASVTLPGVTTPPVSKPTATKKILESETRSDLTLSELKRIVSDLEQKYTGKQVIKFNASWIVEENGGTE
jgi:hypothetical protein